MLKDDLYFIQNTIADNNSVEAIITLNSKHSIFEGHFPSQPVLPGVCMMQMTKEILETVQHIKLQLSKADDIRFSAMIIPDGKELLFSIQYKPSEENALQVVAKITKEETICFKMKAMFILVQQNAVQ